MSNTAKRIDRTRVTLRPICNEDIPFLLRLYASTRTDIQSTGLPQDQLDLLIRSQFEAQHGHYQNYFPNATFQVIELDRSPIGRMYVNVSNVEIRLIDIALLPETRSLGIGTSLLNEWIQITREFDSPLPIRLRVNPESPARRLYEKLGFKVIADEQVNWHMEWTPDLTTPCQMNHATKGSAMNQANPNNSIANKNGAAIR